MSASAPSPAAAAFEHAMRDFKAKLNDKTLYAEILATTSIEQVYDLTDKLQGEQGKSDHLRHLGKIKPYLDRLHGYAGTIDTFVQAKPDILALIWGPIKLLIQWASTLLKSLDALVNTVAEIGLLLPEFEQAVRLFGENDRINDVLALFFQDILDFYLVSLKFFSMKRMKSFFEALWPRKKEEIERIMNSIGRHTNILRGQVRLEHIQEEYNARARDIQHFEELRRSTRRLEYNALQTAVDPRFYNDKLYLLRSRFCPGTGDWLLQDPDMRRWIEVSQDSPRVMWLRGIPGAGKTFLAARVVDEVRRRNRTIYAFLSHSLSGSTTALSTLHSLIFQLAQEDDDLQDVACQTSQESLTSDLKSAADLLTKLLNCAAPVHIVLDGVDEIDEGERRALIAQMIDISTACSETRVLIASREHYDIEKLLHAASTMVRVNTRNEGSIQKFVAYGFTKWLEYRDFNTNEVSEIMGHVSPISTQAEGMFMYARIVSNILESLNSIDEIREELRVLPKDLDEAYGRIFSRINKSLPEGYVREKARKVLGWIGCSPAPLTIQELEQALSIRIGDTSQSLRRYSTLDIVHLCGPVVEVVGGEVQFVHFTAKEYLFSKDIPEFLDMNYYTLSLAKCCITYLCQPHHDPTIDDALVKTHLINGVYRLHYYSVSMWSRLVERYLSSTMLNKTSPEYTELVALLQRLQESRANSDYCPSTERPNYPILSPLKDRDEDLYQLVCGEAGFRDKSDTSQFRLGEGLWESFDPLTVRRISESIHRIIDTIVCSPVHSVKHNHPTYTCASGVCDEIIRNYGPSPFKCPFFGCEFHRRGFKTKAERNAHSEAHDRPMKCDVEGCEYADIGFLSRRMREEHLERCHRADEPLSLAKSEGLDNGELLTLLLALVRADKVQDVQALRPSIGSLDGREIFKLLLEVASLGSENMLRIFKLEDIQKAILHNEDSDLSFSRPRKELRCSDLATISIQSGNLEGLKWILDIIKQLQLNRVIRDLLAETLKSEKSAAMFELLEEFFVRLCSPGGSTRISHKLFCFESDIIKSTRGEFHREMLLIRLWSKLQNIEAISTRAYGNALCFTASTILSIHLASALLGLGADIDHRTKRNQPTPLHKAAQTDTQEAANFIKFLLYRGANPNASYVQILHNKETKRYSNGPNRFVSEEIGAKGIAKWLGKSWEELVDETKEARAVRGQKDRSKD